MTPEFARPERLDTIGTLARAVTVTADAAEGRRLAGRFGLAAVATLTGAFTVQREGAGIRVRGRVTAHVVQHCSITGDPLPAAVDETVELMFMPLPIPSASDAGDEIELTDDMIDVVFHDGDAIDLGETAAETMALALDPVPRGPNADAAVREGRLKSSGGAGPFGQLADLLKKD